MFTTAGFNRSTTSAKLTSGAPTPDAGRVRLRAVSVLAGAPAATDDCATPPATIAPIRKATHAVSATVTIVKRRDISVFHYMRSRNASNSCSFIRSTPSFSAFSSLLPASAPNTR